MSRPKLYLLDGSSYLFRAFHALPPLSNSRGEATGALFGVVNMIRRMHKSDAPEHVAFVFDASGPTFRNELYDQYKANRPPMPDELRSQIEPLLAIVTAMGLPLLRVKGVEADDVIGTLAVRARDAGYDVVVSSSDKDLAQLVDEHVVLVNTMTDTTLDVAGVKAKFGVAPSQIVDYLTLVGDSVDNVPGVPKCGAKTAAKWLNAYGDLDVLMARADEIGGKVGENLRASLDTLGLSRELVTLKLDVALDLGPDQLQPSAPNVAALRELYGRYELSSALRELDLAHGNAADQRTTKGEPVQSLADTATREATPTDYTTILEQADLDHWLERLGAADLIAFDTETTSLNAHQAELVGVSFAIQAGQAAYLPLGHDYPGAPRQLDLDLVLAKLKPLLEDPQLGKLGQHIKYDMNVLARYGIQMQGVRHDSMLQSYVLNSTATRHDMDSLARHYLDIATVSFTDIAGKGAKQLTFNQIPLEQAAPYAAEDADITLRLYQTLQARLKEQTSLLKVYETLEIPLIPVLARMEQRGVRIDPDMLARQSRELNTRMGELRLQAYEVAGRTFSLDSPQQLRALLFDEFELPVTQRTPKGQPSTNEDALRDLAELHELPRLIVEYRSLTKLVSTYTDRLPEQINPHSGRVHTSYHQAVAATGRLSSSDPNLQNIPIRTEEGRRIRQAFVAAPGWRILAADYSQIELRIMAHLSEDPGLLRAFRDGLDVHRATAAEVFAVELDAVDGNQRRAAKAINFGLMYGMSAFGLARQLGIDRKQAGAYIETYFHRYPGVRDYMDRIRAQAHSQGYVETLYGRRLYLPEINARNGARRQGAERAAINAPMQGSAADIIKRAMIAVDAWLDSRQDQARMVMQVHDELVLEVSEKAVEEISAGLVERMSAAAELAVPLVVDVGVGSNWDEAH